MRYGSSEKRNKQEKQAGLRVEGWEEWMAGAHLHLPRAPGDWEVELALRG